MCEWYGGGKGGSIYIAVNGGVEGHWNTNPLE
jgi:hypothetical protein